MNETESTLDQRTATLRRIQKLYASAIAGNGPRHRLVRAIVLCVVLPFLLFGLPPTYDAAQEAMQGWYLPERGFCLGMLILGYVLLALRLVAVCYEQIMKTATWPEESDFTAMLRLLVAYSPLDQQAYENLTRATGTSHPPIDWKDLDDWLSLERESIANVRAQIKAGEYRELSRILQGKPSTTATSAASET